MAEQFKRYAVVTGSNKGIGLEICRQLASKGILVVLTARNETRGLEALEKLVQSGLSENIVFHQLDVTDPTSIASLSEFVRTQFGKIDILVNNAGIGGNMIDQEAIKACRFSGTEYDMSNIWRKVLIENYELTEECLKTNYYGLKGMTEALLPLLQLSDSPKIVNVSSTMGLLKEKIDELLTEFLKDFKEGSLEAKGWPTLLSSYTMSKAALNAYTRILARRYPKFYINCVCPGFVKTDINNNTGTLTVEEGAATPVKLALLPNGGPSGLYFSQGEPASYEG